jgi:spore maturation protein CgeB
LIATIEHALGHEEERRAVAAAGQRRALGEHSFALRMAELAQILEGRL